MSDISVKILESEGFFRARASSDLTPSELHVYLAPHRMAVNSINSNEADAEVDKRYVGVECRTNTNFVTARLVRDVFRE